jgi:hypothetical protein
MVTHPILCTLNSLGTVTNTRYVSSKYLNFDILQLFIS